LCLTLLAIYEILIPHGTIIAQVIRNWEETKKNIFFIERILGDQYVIGA